MAQEVTNAAKEVANEVKKAVDETGNEDLKQIVGKAVDVVNSVATITDKILDVTVCHAVRIGAPPSRPG